MFNRIIAVAALGLFAAAGAQAASQEEWASPNPAQIVAQSAAQSQAPQAASQPAQALNFKDVATPDYMQAAAPSQVTRAAVNADTQRWMNDGLRQYGAGEGNALHSAQTRAALNAYNSQRS